MSTALPAPKPADKPSKPPKAKRGAKNGKLANQQGLVAPLKAAQAPEVIARYFADERSADIAASLGVTRSALNQWLLRTCEDDWRAAQIARAITRKEQAEEEIESAQDPLSLARAREKLKSAQWDLERIFMRMYGAKPMQITVNTTNYDAGLVGSISELIDRKAEAEDADIIDEQRSNQPDPSSEV